jgi:hypothetical protein
MSDGGKHVPVARTVVAMSEYARAVVRSWSSVSGDEPTKATVAVLWAQYMAETGGSACWNWNIGNVKKADGDGYDYIMLRGVWEAVAAKEAERLIAAGLATLDTRENHKRAVGSRVAVVFQPPHRATWFRAYPDLITAMQHHIAFLKRRFVMAWSHALAGDPDGFAFALKAGRDGKPGTFDDYFTADAKAYARNMRPHFDAFMRSDVFDRAIAERDALRKADTIPNLDSIATDPDMTPEPTRIHRAEDLGLVESDSGASRRAAVTGDDIVDGALREIAKRNS